MGCASLHPSYGSFHGFRVSQRDMNYCGEALRYPEKNPKTMPFPAISCHSLYPASPTLVASLFRHSSSSVFRLWFSHSPIYPLTCSCVSFISFVVKAAPSPISSAAPRDIVFAHPRICQVLRILLNYFNLIFSAFFDAGKCVSVPKAYPNCAAGDGRRRGQEESYGKQRF